MLDTDKKDFYLAMNNCFQNFRAAVSKEMIEEWFEELKQYQFLFVKKAFTKYVNENDKFSPTRGAIIKIIRILMSKEKEEFHVSFLRKCAKDNCLSQNINRVNDEEYLCEKHRSERILMGGTEDPYCKYDCERIILSEKIIEENKRLGISNKEGFIRWMRGRKYSVFGDVLENVLKDVI